MIAFILQWPLFIESRIWIKWTNYIVATPTSYISVNRGRRYRLVCWVDRSLWADAVIIHICHRLHNVVFIFNTVFFTLCFLKWASTLCTYIGERNG